MWNVYYFIVHTYKISYSLKNGTKICRTETLYDDADFEYLRWWWYIWPSLVSQVRVVIISTISILWVVLFCSILHEKCLTLWPWHVIVWLDQLMMMYDDISTTKIEVRIRKASSADTSLLLGLQIKARGKVESHKTYRYFDLRLHLRY